MKNFSLLASLLVLGASCSAPKPVETVATPAESLIARMDTLNDHGYMYGHQDDPFYGITWQWEKERSDTKELVGDYPAVMGFELGGIEMGDLLTSTMRHPNCARMRDYWKRPWICRCASVRKRV